MIKKINRNKTFRRYQGTGNQKITRNTTKYKGDKTITPINDLKALIPEIEDYFPEIASQYKSRIEELDKRDLTNEELADLYEQAIIARAFSEDSEYGSESVARVLGKILGKHAPIIKHSAVNFTAGFEDAKKYGVTIDGKFTPNAGYTSDPERGKGDLSDDYAYLLKGLPEPLQVILLDAAHNQGNLPGTLLLALAKNNPEAYENAVSSLQGLNYGLNTTEGTPMELAMQLGKSQKNKAYLQDKATDVQMMAIVDNITDAYNANPSNFIDDFTKARVQRYSSFGRRNDTRGNDTKMGEWAERSIAAAEYAKDLVDGDAESPDFYYDQNMNGGLFRQQAQGIVQAAKGRFPGDGTDAAAQYYDSIGSTYDNDVVAYRNQEIVNQQAEDASIQMGPDQGFFFDPETGEAISPEVDQQPSQLFPQPSMVQTGQNTLGALPETITPEVLDFIEAKKKRDFDLSMREDSPNLPADFGKYTGLNSPEAIQQVLTDPLVSAEFDNYRTTLSKPEVTVPEVTDPVKKVSSNVANILKTTQPDVASSYSMTEADPTGQQALSTGPVNPRFYTGSEHYEVVTNDDGTRSAMQIDKKGNVIEGGKVIDFANDADLQNFAYKHKQDTQTITPDSDTYLYGKLPEGTKYPRGAYGPYMQADNQKPVIKEEFTDKVDKKFKKLFGDKNPFREGTYGPIKDKNKELKEKLKEAKQKTQAVRRVGNTLKQQQNILQKTEKVDRERPVISTRKEKQFKAKEARREEAREVGEQSSNKRIARIKKKEKLQQSRIAERTKRRVSKQKLKKEEAEIEGVIRPAEVDTKKKKKTGKILEKNRKRGIKDKKGYDKRFTEVKENIIKQQEDEKKRIKTSVLEGQAEKMDDELRMIEELENKKFGGKLMDYQEEGDMIEIPTAEGISTERMDEVEFYRGGGRLRHYEYGGSMFGSMDYTGRDTQQFRKYNQGYDKRAGDYSLPQFQGEKSIVIGDKVVDNPYRNVLPAKKLPNRKLFKAAIDHEREFSPAEGWKLNLGAHAKYKVPNSSLTLKGSTMYEPGPALQGQTMKPRWSVGAEGRVNPNLKLFGKVKGKMAEKVPGFAVGARYNFRDGGALNRYQGLGEIRIAPLTTQPESIDLNTMGQLAVDADSVNMFNTIAETERPLTRDEQVSRTRLIRRLSNNPIPQNQQTQFNQAINAVEAERLKGGKTWFGPQSKFGKAKKFLGFQEGGDISRYQGQKNQKIKKVTIGQPWAESEWYVLPNGERYRVREKLPAIDVREKEAIRLGNKPQKGMKSHPGIEGYQDLMPYKEALRRSEGYVFPVKEYQGKNSIVQKDPFNDVDEYGLTDQDYIENIRKSLVEAEVDPTIDPKTYVIEDDPGTSKAGGISPDAFGYNPKKLHAWSNKLSAFGGAMPGLYNLGKYLFDKPLKEEPEYGKFEYKLRIPDVDLSDQWKQRNLAMAQARSNTRDWSGMMSNIQNINAQTQQAIADRMGKWRQDKINVLDKWDAKRQAYEDAKTMEDRAVAQRNIGHKASHEQLGSKAIEEIAQYITEGLAPLHASEQKQVEQLKNYVNQLSPDYKVIYDNDFMTHIVHKGTGEETDLGALFGQWRREQQSKWKNAENAGTTTSVGTNTSSRGGSAGYKKGGRIKKYVPSGNVFGKRKKIRRSLY